MGYQWRRDDGEASAAREQLLDTLDRRVRDVRVSGAPRLSDIALQEPILELAPAPTLRVAWLGPGLEDVQDLVEAEVFRASSIAEVAARDPDVLHVAQPGVNLRALRRAVPRAALVLDIAAHERPVLERRGIGRARADRILVGSRVALREIARRRPELAEHACVVMKPLDLERHSPARQLAKLPGMDSKIKRFRRVHRLKDPVVLFVGPYTADGRLDLTIDWIHGLRERFPELRLAAIPSGSTDSRFLDRCERAALGLGHHGVIEWSVAPEEISIWYALATVVVSPHAHGSAVGPAALAAAAGRPFVGTLGGSAEEIVVDGETGFLLPPDDLTTLRSALEAVVGDEEEAARLGEAARERAERELGDDAAARFVQRAWVDATRRAHGRFEIDG